MAYDLVQAGSVVDDSWEVVGKIREGGYGQIYYGRDTATAKLVALKLESMDNVKHVLMQEAVILKQLQDVTCMCQFISSGFADCYNFIVMDLYGPNLLELRLAQASRYFSMSTSLRLSAQMLESISTLHRIGYVHLDVKPSNFAIGREGDTYRRVIMLDLGMSRPHRAPFKDAATSQPFRGTTAYASINVHRGLDSDRRDDLWSLFYSMVEFVSGELPWRKYKKDRGRVAAKKLSCFCKRQVWLKKCPDELKVFLRHVASLHYGDTPNYALLAELLSSCADQHGVGANDPYDWENEDLTVKPLQLSGGKFHY